MITRSPGEATRYQINFVITINQLCNLIPSLNFEVRGLKFYRKTPHVNVIKVSNQIFKFSCCACILVMCLGQNFLTRVGSGQPSMLWVWKISPKNVKFFNFFLLGSKKISSGWVKKYPSQRRVGPLFTAGQ